MCRERCAQRGRGTTAAAAAGSLPPAQRGVQGGARPLALSGSCCCIAAVPERVERRQRCQLPPAGAAAATWGHEARTPAGAGERARAHAAACVRRGRRPSGNALAAAARRTLRGWGAGAASANGGAVGTQKGWPRRGRWLGRQRCALLPLSSARRYDTGSTFPAAQLLPVSCTCRGAPCGLRAAAAPTKGAAPTG